MSIILLAYLPALIGIAIVALIVFLRRSQSRTMYTLFCLMLVAIVAWLAIQMVSLLVSNDASLLWLRVSILFSNIVAPLVLLFALVYSKLIKRSQWLLGVVIFVPAVILSILINSPDIIYFVYNEGYRQIIKTGYLYDIQALYVAVFTIIATIVLAWYATTARSRRGATILLIIGFLIPLTVNVVVNYVIVMDVAVAQYYLPFSFLIMVSIIAYAMIKHQLFDIKLTIIRSAAYIAALITLGVVYYMLVYVLSVFLFRDNTSSNLSVSPINIFLALLSAFLFQPIKAFFDRITNNIFYRDTYNSDEFFASFNRVLRSTTDLRTLLRRASEEIALTLKSNQVFFFVYHTNEHYISAGTPHHANLILKDAHRLDGYLDTRCGDVIVTDLLQQNELLRKLLERYKIAMLLPLASSGYIIGYLALGEQQSGGYAPRDTKVLTTISDGLVIAIQNALSIQEVKELNISLQDRIDEATKELRASNAQLQRLDQAKDEFVSMASHQLRTPLTSVKGYLSMVLEGDVGKITDTQRHLLGEAFSSSERMVHLINDFLNVSRLQTGKFMLDQRAVDLSKIVQQEVDTLKPIAASHNLKLTYRIPSYFPLLYLDENKIRQVIMNFIDNAIYYSTTHSTITVKLAVVDGDAVLKVCNVGIGVPEDEQAHLFTKFFRATNARKQRPDGTGVGLYLTKRVIAEHGGKMVFESLPESETTFGFRLPVKKLSLAPTDNTN